MRLTDATLRAASLAGEDLSELARELDGLGFAALDAFGADTYEALLRDGRDPWAALHQIHEAVTATPIQALLLGQGVIGPRQVADDVVCLFIETAAAAGVAVFRVADPLNDMRNLEAPIRFASETGARVQGALSYATSPVHDLDHWRSLAVRLAALGVADLVVQDPAGLLTPRAVRELIPALRGATDLPVIVHSRGTCGLAAMTYLAAAEAGAAGLDTVLAPVANGSSLPAAESVATALGLEAGPLAHPVPLELVDDIRRRLAGHEAQARLGDALAEVPLIQAELGYPPLVATVRELVAEQAVYNVLGGERYATVSQELKEYLQGLYGTPPGPADAELRRLVLGQDEPITLRPADLLEPQVPEARAQQPDATDEAVLNRLLLPDLPSQPAARAEATPAPADPAPEPPAPPAEASADPAPPAQGVSAEFDVEVEGELFRVRVASTGMAVVPMAAAVGAAGPGPARPARDGAVTAPMQGLIVKVPVSVGDDVNLGDVVAVLEAMKMQNDITATKPGKVVEIYVKEGDVVSPNQPLVAVS